MGANTFSEFHSVERDQDLLSSSVRKSAFTAAVANAQYEYGHGGYTGTLAEKSEVRSGSTTVFETLEAAYAAADELVDTAPFEDKWGPAGYLVVSGEKHYGYVFFGWASC